MFFPTNKYISLWPFYGVCRASHRQSVLQFSSVIPSSSSPQTFTDEKMSATSTAKQESRATMAMHFCWFWKGSESDTLSKKSALLFSPILPCFMQHRNNLQPSRGRGRSFLGGAQKGNDQPLNVNAPSQCHWPGVRIHDQYNTEPFASAWQLEPWFDSQTAERFKTGDLTSLPASRISLYATKQKRSEVERFSSWRQIDTHWSPNMRTIWKLCFMLLLYIACFVIQANPSWKRFLWPLCQGRNTRRRIHDK